MPKITFLPSQISGEINPEETVLECGWRLSVEIHSTCGGVARCTDCKLKVIDGMKNLPRPEFEETNVIGNTWHITKERLACQLRDLKGDITVEVLEPFEKKAR